MNDNKDVVYHYCSIDSFLGIIQNYMIRLSDIEKPSDFNDRRIMLNQVEVVFLKELANSINSEDITKIIDSYHKINNIMQLRRNHIACFSANGDLLSLWKSNGQEGYGIAIGFSKESLQQLNNYNELGVKFSNVEYGARNNPVYSTMAARKLIELTKSGLNLLDACAHVLDNEISDMSFYKSATFSVEKEWRISAALDPMNANHELQLEPFTMLPAKLKSNSKQIITYVDLEFSNIKKEIIKEIVLGSKCLMSNEDTKRIFGILGYNSDIIINRSNCVR